MATHVLSPVDLLDLEPGTRLGNWTVVGRLGWGGYGAVYLVRGLRWPWRQAALKLALAPGPVSHRLLREKQLLKRVRHARVVRLLDSGQWLAPGRREPLPFLVMKYVPGTHLYAWAWQRNPRLEEMLEHFRDSALALHAVHEADAVHRDVKGENLLVGRNGRVMLVDLGAGYYQGAEAITEGPRPPGTRPYRSPEFLRYLGAGAFEERYECRPADDLYALGVTWYRTLTDELPFEAENSERARREGQLPRAPSELNPRVPKAVSDLVLKLLASEPEARPASAREVAEAVEALLSAGGSELQAHLFAWDEGPSEHSRTTGEEALEGQVAPGDEDAVMEDMAYLTLRQSVKRDRRRLRRRPRPRGWDALLQRWPPRRGLVVGAVLGTGLVVGFWLYSMDTTQGDNEMQASKLSVLGRKALQSLLCVATVSGCASVPVTPAWPRDCPPEALAAMKELDIKPGRWGYLQLDTHQQGFFSEPGVYREGPVISLVTERETFRAWPLGTKLYGHLWIGKQWTHVHWTRAELPGGREIPICAKLSQKEDWPGFHLEEGPEPGTVLVPKQAPMFVTDRFERPD